VVVGFESLVAPPAAFCPIPGALDVVLAFTDLAVTNGFLAGASFVVAVRALAIGFDPAEGLFAAGNGDCGL